MIGNLETQRAQRTAAEVAERTKSVHHRDTETEEEGNNHRVTQRTQSKSSEEFKGFFNVFKNSV